jgi:hypothetical protein
MPATRISSYADASRRGDPMRWPVERNPVTGETRIQLPDGGWISYTEEALAVLLLEVATADDVNERHFAIVRRLAGEDRFAEFVELHSLLAANGRVAA